MPVQFLRFTYIGGPTALLEFGAMRLLTDPTFDPAPTAYELKVYTLRKTHAPALDAKELGKIDVVLLSHDHHMDNLDQAGRAMLGEAGLVLTTKDGAERLGGNARGMVAWDQMTLPTEDGRVLHVIATPARHGPAGGDRGPVIGFVLFYEDAPKDVVYVSGDTVWFEGVEEVARKFDVKAAVLFLGAAKVAVAGPSHLTFTADEGVKVARAMPRAKIIPAHFEGWEHFSQGRADIERAFADAKMADRLVWGEAGRSVEVRI
ncbi:MAG TPA: MBL fold metallo-hydrolase [Tepidisphaeraceae bacterium]|jgi:L-ascorbate metabolism protein UlaG (beta-lactamase superfamily)